MIKIGSAMGILLVLVGSVWAVPPWNFERKFSTPQQIQALAMPADSVHSYDVRFYRLDINLPMTSGAMTARERIALMSRIANMDTFSLYMGGLVCDSVKRGSTRLAFTAPSGWLRITLDRPFAIGESLDVDVFYHRNSGTPNNGFYWFSRADNGYSAIAYTLTEPSDARNWFPCWDEPWDKAERGCMISITVPDTFTACSNGLLDSTTTNPSARTKTFWWNHRYPIATYLMSFAASKYATWSHHFVRAPGDTVEIKYYVWPIDSICADTFFRNVVDMITFFSRPDVYGPYPFEKYGMVIGHPYGGMENQTMTIIPHYWLGLQPEIFLAHEMSHQWWGDMVTCYNWANIWLNEGFASYSNVLYAEHQRGHIVFLDTMAVYAQYYFTEDVRLRFPLYNPPPNHLFDWGTIYCKGAWVQHMLRYVENDTSATHGLFFQALRTYGDSLKYGTASIADYQRIHERIYGDTLNWFFDEWVYQAGYPQYRVNWFGISEGANWRIVVDISQSNGNQAPPVFHMPVEILFHLAGKDTLVHYPINSSPQRDEFVVSSRPDSAVFDPGYWILKKVTMTNVGVETADRKAVLTPFALGSAAPTPFNQETRIFYSLARTGKTELVVYDVSGRKVRTLMDREGSPGASWVKWDGRDDLGRKVPSGVYFYRLQAGAFSDTKKMVLIR